MSMPIGPVLIAAAAAVLAAGSPAMAGPTGVEAAVGNTVVSTHPDGRQARLWLRADHSYRAQGRNGKRSGGTWKLKGEKLCLSQKSPYPGPFALCRSFRQAAVGQRWKDKAFNGEAVTNEIKAGQ